MAWMNLYAGNIDAVKKGIEKTGMTIDEIAKMSDPISDASRDIRNVRMKKARDLVSWLFGRGKGKTCFSVVCDDGIRRYKSIKIMAPEELQQYISKIEKNLEREYKKIETLQSRKNEVEMYQRTKFLPGLAAFLAPEPQKTAEQDHTDN
jgi:hypothetical protein